MLAMLLILIKFQLVRSVVLLLLLTRIWVLPGVVLQLLLYVSAIDPNTLGDLWTDADKKTVSSECCPSIVADKTLGPIGSRSAAFASCPDDTHSRSNGLPGARRGPSMSDLWGRRLGLSDSDLSKWAAVGPLRISSMFPGVCTELAATRICTVVNAERHKKGALFTHVASLEVAQGPADFARRLNGPTDFGSVLRLLLLDLQRWVDRRPRFLRALTKCIQLGKPTLSEYLEPIGGGGPEHRMSLGHVLIAWGSLHRLFFTRSTARLRWAHRTSCAHLHSGGAELLALGFHP